MSGNAHTGEKVQQRLLVPFHQPAEGLFIPETDARHQGNIIRFLLFILCHEGIIVNKAAEKKSLLCFMRIKYNLKQDEPSAAAGRLYN